MNALKALALVIALTGACKSETPMNDPPSGETAAQTDAEDTPAELAITAVHGGKPTPSGGYGTSYMVTARQLPNFDAEIDTLLDETVVNSVATLREYIVAIRDNDTVRIQEVQANGDRNAETPLFEMSLSNGSTPVFQFWRHGDQYSGPHVERFMKLLVEKGAALETSPPPPGGEGANPWPKKPDPIPPQAE